MALITRSKYGLVAVNNEAIKTVISKCFEEMTDIITPCNKKGRMYKRTFLGKDPSILNSIEITEEKGVISIDVYYVQKFGESINDTANRLFDMIEMCFNVIRIEKPERLSAHVMGLVSKQLVKRDIVVDRFNNEEA